ncbi:hypothetical protein C2G38_2165130 [Gigaspora rosea]|uniref:Uncharacterized protein n=1 Tax=Gigaspora rosea TaxID=44941 RepID=A0A397W0G5_9GLOM|nr:hypothetical protein C2G38_2165130 [Gigaspora rosea]
MGKQEIIILIIKLLWITKGGDDFSVTFNGKFATVLDQDNSTSVALDMTINDESYRNIVNALNSAPNFFIEKHGENFKQSSSSSISQPNTSGIAIQEIDAQSSSFDIEDDSTNKKSNLSDVSDASASVAKSLTHEESNDQLSNDVEKDQENEIQGFDSVAIPLSLEESDDQSSNAIERDQRNETQDLNMAGMTIQEDDSNGSVSVEQYLNHDENDNQLSNAIEKNQENEIQGLGSVAQPLDHEESDDQSSNSIEMNQENEIQVLDSSVQDLLQYDSLQSDEYADSIEEVDEQRSNTLTSRLSKKNSGKQYQPRINKKFKVSKKSKTKLRQVSNEPINDSIERVPSYLTDDDSLPSVNEILKLPITQSNHSSKETNISHPDAETSVVESNRINVLAISSIIDNQQKPSTSSSNINEQNPSDEFMDYQHTYETEHDRQYPIVLIPSIDTNISSANPDATKVRTEFLRDNNLKSKKRKRTSKLSSNDKGKKKIQYPLYEGDSDAYDSEQSHASILTEGSQISGRLNEKEFTQETDTTNSKKILDTVNKIETNEALLLKNNFRNFRNSQLIVYGDRLFSKNRSIEDLLTTKFSHIFNDNDVINCSSSLPSYSTNNIESLENYFKVWSLQYDQLNSTKAQLKEKMLKLLYELGRAYLSLLVTLANEYEQKMGKLPTQKTLRGFVVEKIKSILNIDDRQERKYWRGTWRLIELLNITHCPASILIESGITVRYLMISENEKYDQFLKNLLDDTVTRHETPIFDESLIQRIRNKVLLF